MSRIYRGKEIFKPLNTGRIDEHVSCIREWIANIFFYTKDGTTYPAYRRNREPLPYRETMYDQIHWLKSEGLI